MSEEKKSKNATKHMSKPEAKKQVVAIESQLEAINAFAKREPIHTAVVKGKISTAAAKKEISTSKCTAKADSLKIETHKNAVKNETKIDEIKEDNKREGDTITPSVKKRLESMSDEEILQENLKELLERKSREERRANGRFVAVLIAFLVIFLAIYHAWIRKTAGLAGILLPAAIMLTYGSWIVILAKRDKAKKAMLKKHLEEMALKNEAALEERARARKAKRQSEKKHKNEFATLSFENEVPLHGGSFEKNKCSEGGHRKHRDRQRSGVSTDPDSGNYSSGSSSSNGNGNSLNNPTLLAIQQPVRQKRPSIRQKLFRQNATNASALPTSPAIVPGVVIKIPVSVPVPVHQSTAKKNRLQRLNAVPTPQMARMGSAP